MKDPFLELYSLMGEATKIEASFFIAKVISPLPNLKIQLNDLTLDKDDFLISYGLKDILNINDEVVLLRVDDKFIILSKVVSI